jgi:ribulose bisphosphate carboxylase small subunit
MKKIKIKSHPNLRPFKNSKVRHFIWGLNEVSFEISTEYVRIYNFRPKQLERYYYFIIYAMKKIKIKSHSNLQPFKNVKVRHSIWGFNEVSFEISTEYVQMHNFRPKQLERYNYFIIYAVKKIKIKSHPNLRPFKNTKVRHFIWGLNEVSFEISTEYVRIYNFRPKQLERYNYFIVYAMKKIKIKSHSNLQPFKNVKVQHSISGFNEVSFEISTEYLRMYNFRPKELERYNYFIIYAMKKIKIKSHPNLRPFKNTKVRHFIWGLNEVSFEISTEYVRIYNFRPKQLERYNYFIIYAMKKIKIKSHSNLQPFKNVKVRHSIWGFNEVSFEISTEYVRMYNFRPKELERYNYFIIYAMKKIKIKSHPNLRPFKNTKVRHFIWGFNEVSFEISTEYVRIYNFRPKQLERYNYFIIYAMKKIKIKSHSNLQPFKNVKVRHSIWGFNEVSFEISTEYVQMPKELERYNYFIIYGQICGPSRTRKCLNEVSFEISIRTNL